MNTAFPSIIGPTLSALQLMMNVNGSAQSSLINNHRADATRELNEVLAGPTNGDDDAQQGGSTRPSCASVLVQKGCSLLLPCVGEVLGTFLLTLVICTSLAAAVLTGAQEGIWQVAFPSGLGVAISIYLSAHMSDAHLNPAMTLAFGIVRFRQFHWSRILPYMVAQVLGGLLAGVFVFVIYHSVIEEFEDRQGIVRGENGSELSAMIFGEYFPNPALFPHDNSANLKVVSVLQACFIEAWGTGILVFVVFGATNPHNALLDQSKVFVPLIVGITVACLISLYGPLTQAGWNPVRDFCPRVVAALAGWGPIAIPGPRNGFWVYIVGPLIGGPIGGALSDALVWCVNKFKVQSARLEQ